MCDKTADLEMATVKLTGDLECEQEQRKTSDRSRPNVNPTVTVLKVQQIVILVILILLTAVILQIPTILYYADQPSLSTSLSIGIDIDFDTCSVSSACMHITGLYMHPYSCTCGYRVSVHHKHV